MADTEIKRIKDPDDPERCQHVIPSKGQCVNISTDASEYCIVHGKTAGADPARTYRLTKFKNRLNHFASDPKAKSLNEEIGILRMTLEEILNRCEDTHALTLQAGVVSEMTVKIEKLVTSCDKLDQRRGQLLDKSVLLRFAVSVVDIISDVYGDDDRNVDVANRIMQTLGDTAPEEPTDG